MQEKSNKSLFINPKGFEQAAVEAHQGYYSTPYKCLNPARQGERAACLLKDGRVISEVPGYSPHLRNPDGSYDLNALEQHFGSPVKKMVYRPNHDLLHAMRQAALAPEIKAFYDKHIPGKFAKMEPKHLERLQLMLLFAVSKREDETGFSDPGKAKEEFYKQYRKNSALAYLEYAKQCPGLYEGPEAEKELYHDALLVEVMGFASLKPEILEGNSYEMIRLMNEKKIPIPETYDPHLNAALDLLNIAHSLDLLRVYPPTSSDDANSKKNIDKLFNAGLSELVRKKELTEDNVKGLIKDTILMLQYSQKMLLASGEKQATKVDLDEKKIDKILESPELKSKIQTLINDPNNYYQHKIPITNFIGGEIFTSGKYEYDSKRFDYCHYKANSNRDADRDFEKDVTSGMNMLNSIQRPKLSTAASEILNSKQVVIDAANELVKQTNLADQVGIIPRVVGYEAGKDNESKPLESIQFVFKDDIQKEAFRKNIGLPSNAEGVYDGVSVEWKPIFQIPPDLVTNLLIQMKNKQAQENPTQKLQSEDPLQKKQLVIATANELVSQAKVGNVKIIPRVVGYKSGEDSQSKPLESIQFVFADIEQRDQFMKETGLPSKTEGVYAGKSNENKPFLLIKPDLVPELLDQMKNNQAQEKAAQEMKSAGVQLQKNFLVIDTAKELIREAKVYNVKIIPRVVGYQSGETSLSKPLESIQFEFAGIEQRAEFMKKIGLQSETEGVSAGESNEKKPFLLIQRDLIPKLLDQMKNNQVQEKAAQELKSKQELQKKQLVIGTANELVKQARVGEIIIQPRAKGFMPGEDNESKPLASIQFVFDNTVQKEAFRQKIGLPPGNKNIYKEMNVYDGFSAVENKPIFQIPPELVTDLLIKMKNSDAQKCLDNFKNESDTLLSELKKEKATLVNKDDPEYTNIVQFTDNLIKKLERYSNEFYRNPSPETFEKYETECGQAFKKTEDEAKIHRGWAKTNSIVKGFVGILAAITIIPALAVAIQSDAGFFKTFFDKPEETNTSKKVSDFKNRFTEQKTTIKKASDELPIMKPKQS